MHIPKYPEAEKINSIISKAQELLLVQPDNPDADSLASSLALAEILVELGKEVTIYCGVNMPEYLSYIPGFDSIVSEPPTSFDASIIVDTSSMSLLDTLNRNGTKSWLASKPCIVIDHHATNPTIDFANLFCAPPAASTGEVIYELSSQLNWPLTLLSRNLIASSILGDSLGLTTTDTTARTIAIIAELVDNGVSLPELENVRRDSAKRDAELIYYKGRLLQRVEFYQENQIAMLHIPWDEIEKYSPLYNPPMLVMDDMRLTRGTKLAICFKEYPDGKITAKIRANYGFGIADKLAEHFGGGGHQYAAGFKVQDGRGYEELKRQTIERTIELLAAESKS